MYTHIHIITQYQSRALVIRYNRAVLEPSGDFQVDEEGETSSGSAGFPWWGILIIAVGALVLVAAISVVVMVSHAELYSACMSVVSKQYHGCIHID